MSRLDEKRFTALDQEWIARFDFNTTCAIEAETGESFYTVAAPFIAQIDKDDAKDPAKVLAALGNRYNSRIRLMLFHALSSEHDLTVEDVGQIIGDIGLKGAMEIVLWAISLALDAGGEEAEGNAIPTPVPQPNRKQRKTAAKRG